MAAPTCAVEPEPASRRASAAMTLVMLAIGLMGPKTLGQSLERIAH